MEYTALIQIGVHSFVLCMKGQDMKRMDSSVVVSPLDIALRYLSLEKMRQRKMHHFFPSWESKVPLSVLYPPISSLDILNLHVNTHVFLCQTLKSLLGFSALLSIDLNDGIPQQDR